MFNERLKQLRIENDYTQQELADLTELSKPTISRFEGNKKTPSRESVTKIAKVFNVSTDYLLGLSDHRNLDENQSSEVKVELNNMINKIEKLSEDQQKMILNMIKGAVNSLDD
ncbi:helix-turn-helix domain-containing protein [Bacillus cereus]|nr:helix-turn-helix domain-containing protein [Bacillus cereus]